MNKSYFCINSITKFISFDRFFSTKPFATHKIRFPEFPSGLFSGWCLADVNCDGVCKSKDKAKGEGGHCGGSPLIRRKTVCRKTVRRIHRIPDWPKALCLNNFKKINLKNNKNNKNVFVKFEIYKLGFFCKYFFKSFNFAFLSLQSIKKYLLVT